MDTVQLLIMELVLTKFGEILKGEENDIGYIAKSDDQKHCYCYKDNAYSVHGLRKKKEVFIEINSTDYLNFLAS